MSRKFKTATVVAASAALTLWAVLPAGAGAAPKHAMHHAMKHHSKRHHPKHGKAMHH